MLTSDLVRARARNGRIEIPPIGPRVRASALELSSAYIAALDDHVGRTREERDAAWADVPVPGAGQKLSLGLRKLLDDRCDFAEGDGPDPAALRRAVFEAAAGVRARLGPGDVLDRERLLAEVGAPLTVLEAEARLFADLPEAHTLIGWDRVDAAGLVDAYERAQAQAVLLRAAAMTVFIDDADPWVMRALFRKLKFLRLIFSVDPPSRGGRQVRIDIEGPYALFEQTTKYGVQFARVLRALDGVAKYRLRARVLWGRDRQSCSFEHEGGGGRKTKAPVPDEVERLRVGVEKLGGDWKVAIADQWLHEPGLGVVVPDLVLRRGKEQAFVEVLGYWSREAVIRRVEMVERGFPHRVVFCVSDRLRVAEGMLDEQAPACLLVYKGVINPRRVIEKLSR